MSMKITIVGDNGSNVEISVSSAYNPDILDDIYKRASKAFHDALKSQVAWMEPVELEDEQEITEDAGAAE